MNPEKCSYIEFNREGPVIADLAETGPSFFILKEGKQKNDQIF